MSIRLLSRMWPSTSDWFQRKSGGIGSAGRCDYSERDAGCSTVEEGELA